MKHSLILITQKRVRPFLLLAIFVSVFTTVQAQNNSAAPRKRQVSDKCKVERDKLRVEEELRVALRTIRQAIDRYNIACNSGLVGPLDRRVEDLCYPYSLEVLVTGITPPNLSVKVRFLRRIPVDPTTGKREWGLRSAQDEPDSPNWGGQNLFDVYSLSKEKALDGSKYRDW
jgi:general secretion pathway protein G